MNQRGVALVAGYLSSRPKGRVVRVKPVGRDDYVIGIEDVRGGRTHLVRTADDLERWLVTLTQGRCVPAALGICGIWTASTATGTSTARSSPTAFGARQTFCPAHSVSRGMRFIGVKAGN